MDNLVSVAKVLIGPYTESDRIQALRDRSRECRLRKKNKKLLEEGKPGLDNVPALRNQKGLGIKDMTPEQKREYHHIKYLEYTERQKKAKKALEEIMNNITNKIGQTGISDTLTTLNTNESEPAA